MKLNLWYLLLIAFPLAVLMFSGALAAQLAVLGLTFAIFFGTLTLRRPEPGDATTTHTGH
jgi:hypothetical protein